MCHCGISTVLPLRHESLASIDSYRQLSTNIDRVPAVGRGKHISLSLTAVDTMLLFTSLFISLTFVLFFFLFLPFWPGASRSAVGWCTALQTRRSRFRFPMESLEFFIDIILRPHYGSGVDSASDRNEYEEYFLGVKAAGEYGWQPCHHVPIVLKSWILNLLEPSGPVQGFLYLFYVFGPSSFMNTLFENGLLRKAFGREKLDVSFCTARGLNRILRLCKSLQPLLFVYLTVCLLNCSLQEPNARGQCYVGFIVISLAKVFRDFFFFLIFCWPCSISIYFLISTNLMH